MNTSGKAICLAILCFGFICGMYSERQYPSHGKECTSYIDKQYIVYDRPDRLFIPNDNMMTFNTKLYHSFDGGYPNGY